MNKATLNQLANVRERLLFGAIYVVMVMLFWNGFFTPLLEAGRRKQAQLDVLETEKQVLENFAASTPVVQPSLLPIERKDIKMKILSGDVKESYEDLMSFLARVTAADFLGGVTILNLSYQSGAGDQGFTRTPFVMNLKGDYLNVMRYMEKIEQFPALVAVDQIALKSADARFQDVEAEVNGSFYRMGGQPPSPTAVPSAPVGAQ